MAGAGRRASRPRRLDPSRARGRARLCRPGRSRRTSPPGLLWPFNAHFHAPLLQLAKPAGRCSPGSAATRCCAAAVVDASRWCVRLAPRARASADRLRARPGRRPAAGAPPPPAARLPLAAPGGAARRLGRLGGAAGVRAGGMGAPTSGGSGGCATCEWARRPWPGSRRTRTSTSFTRFSTSASRHLAGDAAGSRAPGRERMRCTASRRLLPDELLGRDSKSSFDGAFWGGPARAFAERWDGSGVDTALVDPVGAARGVAVGVARSALVHAPQAAWLERARSLNVSSSSSRARGSARQSRGPPQLEGRKRSKVEQRPGSAAEQRPRIPCSRSRRRRVGAGEQPTSSPHERKTQPREAARSGGTPFSASRHRSRAPTRPSASPAAEPGRRSLPEVDRPRAGERESLVEHEQVVAEDRHTCRVRVARRSCSFPPRARRGCPMRDRRNEGARVEALALEPVRHDRADRREQRVDELPGCRAAAAGRRGLGRGDGRSGSRRPS